MFFLGFLTSAPTPKTKKTSYACILICLIGLTYFFSQLPSAPPTALSELHQLQVTIAPDDFTRVARVLENPTQLLSLEDRGAVERVARASGKRSELGKLLASLLSGKFATAGVPRTTTHLRLLTTEIPIPASDGTATIANATEVFEGYIDSDFTAWGLDVPGASTPETQASVYEITQDGDFAALFGSFNRPLGQLVMSQAQVIEFCCAHPELLRQDGFPTFFLLKHSERLLVAHARVRPDCINIYIYEFFYDGVWGDARIIIPH